MRGAVLVPCLLLLSGCMGADQSGKDALPGANLAPDAKGNSTFAAPIEGPFAVHFRVDVKPDDACVAYQNLTAVSSDKVSPVIVQYRKSGSTQTLGGGGFGHLVQAYAGPADLRPIIPGGGRVSSSGGGKIGSGLHEIIIASAGFSPGSRSPNSFELTIRCASTATPIEWIAAGNEVVPFNENSLDGGAGASVFLAAGTKTLRATAPHVKVLAGPYGDPTGQVVVRTPNSSKTYTYTPTQNAGFVNMEGGPGTYAVEVNWARVQSRDLMGVIVGLRPIASFEEAVALAKTANS